MKQLWQSISTGKASVAEIPAPLAGPGQILVRVMASLISAGTERSVVEFAEKNLIRKAMARPDLARQFIDKSRRDGWMTTFKAARNRLDTEMALGYSNSGIVIDIGEGVTEFKPGDRVACGGGGFASHSEVVRIPRNLAAVIPDGPGLRAVPFEEAAFATVAAIGLQGVRLAELRIGEVVAVIGLGLIGQIVVQLARANGCTVVGMDPSPQRCQLAVRMGCISAVTTNEALPLEVARFTGGKGADSVLIAAATASNAPVALAAEVARDRATVVAVGAVGLSLPRKPYYMKELLFRVSRSYGPGRYDPAYEEKGHDYPRGYVRWTEGRNIASIVQLLASGQLDFGSLITHRFPIESAEKGYGLIAGKSGEPFLGVVITYPEAPSMVRRVELPRAGHASPGTSESVGLGIIGAGNFTTATLLPALKSVDKIRLVGICTSSGSSARSAGAKFGFDYCTSDERELYSDPAINMIAICTRHSDHARQVVAALDAGKSVFCEKPLAMSEEELALILSAIDRSQRNRILMVGYNRRFAPLARQLKAFFSGCVEPFTLHYRVNAGFIPPEHWTQDPEQGGGRIIGEVCHFVDFLSFVCGNMVSSVTATAMDDAGRYSGDNIIASLRFEDGSIGTITYCANGDKSFPKERVEVYSQGRIAVLDDFRALDTVHNGRRRTARPRMGADKGHRDEWHALARCISDGGHEAPIALQDLLNSTLATFAIRRACISGSWLKVDMESFLSQTGETRLNSSTDGGY